jgi:hypothetical protein
MHFSSAVLSRRHDSPAAAGAERNPTARQLSEDAFCGAQIDLPLGSSTSPQAASRPVPAVLIPRFMGPDLSCRLLRRSPIMELSLGSYVRLGLHMSTYHSCPEYSHSKASGHGGPYLATIDRLDVTYGSMNLVFMQ